MINQRFRRGFKYGKTDDGAIPKVKPYVAIRALFTMIIPTDVTTLKNHDAASMAAFLSPLLSEDIMNSRFQYIN